MIDKTIQNPPPIRPIIVAKSIAYISYKNSALAVRREGADRSFRNAETAYDKKYVRVLFIIPPVYLYRFSAGML